MSREELEKLLGGYATGSLTAEERRALMAGALDDQALFDQLAREETLREALDDPAARARLLAVLGEPRRPWWRAIWRPAVLAPAGALGVLALATLITLQLRRPVAPVQVAEVRREVAPPAAPAPAAPVPETLPGKPRERRARPAPPPAEISAALPAAVPPPAPQAADVASPAAPEAAAPRSETAQAPPSAAPSVTALSRTPPPPQRRDAAVVAERAPAPLTPGRHMAFSGGAQDRSLARTSMVSKAANFTLPVDWTLQRRGEDGSWANIPPGQPLRVEDAVRLVLRPSRNGFLAVWQLEASGGRRVLFSGLVQWGSAYIVPAAGALQYDQPGRKPVYARLSEREQPLSEDGAMGILLDYRSPR